PHDLIGVVVGFNSYFDVFFELFLGCGMVLILLEDADRDAERARAERHRDLAESEARLSGVIHSATDGIITVAEGRRIQLITPGAAEIFGWPAGSGVNQSILDHVSVGARAELEGLLDEPSPEGASALRIVTGRRSNGAEFPLELTCSSSGQGP